MAEKYEELKQMTNEELVAKYDHAAQSLGTSTAHYQRELHQREQMSIFTNMAEHLSTIARCADIEAMYTLAKWKWEARNSRTREAPPKEYLYDPRNTIGR